MERINFIGALDKTDMIMYVAEVLIAMGKKVLMVDATVHQKAKYIAPAIEDRTPAYVTNFANIDIAVGFANFSNIKQYLGMPESAVFPYDYIFLDIDNPRLLANFPLDDAKRNYFVTSSDAYALKKGLEVLSGVQAPLELKKIYFSNLMSQEENDYLNFLSEKFNVKWQEEIIYFPLDSSDQEKIMTNQRLSKIKFKGLSSGYKQSLIKVAGDISGDVYSAKRASKQVERGI